LEEYFDADIILDDTLDDTGLLTVSMPGSLPVSLEYIIGGAVGAILALSLFVFYRSGRQNKKPLVKVINPLNEEPDLERAIFPPNRIRGVRL